MIDDPNEETRSQEHTQPGSNAAFGAGWIGPYRLIQKIGEGGMGEVWLAEQSEPIRRTVALKIIKAGMDSKAVIARFEAERQALALMDHACIARVLDAGTTERGRPYFVMEYVQGLPVTEYCDRRRLETRGRLELFVKICQGVQHAHQKAIIHRDLKPSNVLITEQDGRPLPKIIDFGVAKATAQPLTERTLFTELGVLIGTPEYMSPEQARLTGEGIDTRTDIYSLGVMLYELIAGALPFDPKQLRQAGFEGICRIVREQDPLRPSTRLSRLGDTTAEIAAKRRTSPRVLVTLLQGDLDWIVMKALDKDRNRRYETANALAADIRRYLSDEPVYASPPSTPYRFRKLIRRNRGTFAALTAVFVVLVLGVAASTWSMLRAQRAERRAAAEAIEARRQASISEAVNRFLNRDLLSAVAPSGRRGEGRDVTMREVLEVAGERIGKASQGDGQFADKPLVEAAIRSTLGNTYRALGEYALGEPHLVRAVELTERELSDADPELRSRLNDLAYLYFMQGRYEEAEPRYRRAIALEKRLAGDSQDLTNYTLNLAMLIQRRGRYEEAAALFREALVQQIRDDGDQASSTTSTMYKLANLYQETGRYTEAESLQSHVLDVWTRQHGERNPWTLSSMNSLANVYTGQGRLEEAASLLSRTLELKREVYGPENPFTLNTLSGLAEVEEIRGHYSGTEQLHRQVLELRTAALGEKHPQTLYTLGRLAFVIARQGRLAEAESLGLRARTLCKAALGAEDAITLTADDALAMTLIDSGRLPEAEGILRNLLNNSKNLESNDPVVPLAQAHLAIALGKQNKREEAERLFRESLPTFNPWHAEHRRIIEIASSMYEEWHVVAPDHGYDEEAVRLRAYLNGVP